MTFPFNPKEGLIVVNAEVIGPAANAILRLALDTGATRTVINTGLLVAVGYDPALSSDRVELTTASGVEFAPRIELKRVAVLGLIRKGFPILCHTLPPSASVDGLLGLDFFRRSILTLDFRKGLISLETTKK